MMLALMAKKGRKPGRPKTGENADVPPDEEQVLYVKVQGALWNRLNRALERASARDPGYRLTKADVVRRLLTRALDLDETDTSKPSI
jgi:hypothetical protein